MTRNDLPDLPRLWREKRISRTHKALIESFPTDEEHEKELLRHMAASLTLQAIPDPDWEAMLDHAAKVGRLGTIPRRWATEAELREQANPKTRTDV